MFFDIKGTSDLFAVPDEAQRGSGTVVQGSTVYEPKDGAVVQECTVYGPKDGIHPKLIDKLLDPGLRRDDAVIVGQNQSWTVIHSATACGQKTHHY